MLQTWHRSVRRDLRNFEIVHYECVFIPVYNEVKCCMQCFELMSFSLYKKKKIIIIDQND